MGNYRLKGSCKLLRGVATVGETPSLTGESSLEGGARTEQASSIVPSLTPPHRRHHNAATWVARPWQIPKALPPYNRTGVPRQKNMAQNERTIKAAEKELSDKEIANLSDVQFKSLVIRMLTELVELGLKMKEEMKATQGEIKQDIQETNSKGKETRTQINSLEQKK